MILLHIYVYICIYTYTSVSTSTFTSTATSISTSVYIYPSIHRVCSRKSLVDAVVTADWALAHIITHLHICVYIHTHIHISIYTSCTQSDAVVSASRPPNTHQSRLTLSRRTPGVEGKVTAQGRGMAQLTERHARVRHGAGRHATHVYLHHDL